MSSQASRSRSRLRAIAPRILLSLAAFAPDARGQACCAGTGAVTPGRLALHEVALAGVQLKAGTLFGSFDASGTFVKPPRGASELDFEEDLFAALRIYKRGQISVLVPFVETRRAATGLSDFGGGVGDVNLNVRYDFTAAAASKVVPGIAALAGVTFPTGTPPDAQGLGPMAAGATGVGAYQANLGLALEQAWGPWLVNVTGILAQRFARTVRYPAASGAPATSIHEQLALQGTGLAALAYVFTSEAALALSASYTFEGDATIDGARAADTAHRLPAVGLSGVLPLSDTWRLQGGLTLNPPLPALGLNQPAIFGVATTVVRAWN